MKKPLILAFVVGGAIGIGVVVVGATQGWFSSKSPGEKPKLGNKPKPRPKPRETRAEVISTQGKLRLESIVKSSPQDISKVIGLWAEKKGADREISWQAVKTGAATGQKRATRMRCCQLAAALARRPAGVPLPLPADPKAVDPLMSCLSSGDPGLSQAAINALCTMNLSYPALKIKARMLPEVRKLVASGNPAEAAAALSAVPFLKEISMAPAIVAAWERHAKVSGFADKSCAKLRILMELRIKADLKKNNPAWKPAKCAAEARKMLPTLFEKLGRDPAKWKVYWAASRDKS
jgi:hypothetical protein